ncbi:MAG TPA: DUF1232 domain-containing protein [Pyrinomonadaceae bacterium]|nr:DUF1232 domain-containing protein [Pyrinomonadaceae bacterium]
MSELNLRSRMKNLLLVIPNLVLLCARLMVDSRVPAKERLLVAGAIVYALVPLDFIPDMLPFVGQVDDAYLVALSLLRLMSETDPRIVREHWKGGGDVVELVGATALIAARLLPTRIRRVLTSRVEAVKAPSGQENSLSVPMLVERPVPEAKTADVR